MNNFSCLADGLGAPTPEMLLLGIWRHVLCTQGQVPCEQGPAYYSFPIATAL